MRPGSFLSGQLRSGAPGAEGKRKSRSHKPAPEGGRAKMILRRFLAGSAAAALLALPLMAAPAMAQEGETQYFPGLPYRSGPYAPSGIPLGSGYADYLTMLQARDGGINGVPIHYEECDTGYNNDRGVECYERLKEAGPSEPAAWHPLSTGITYALIPRVTQDEYPMLSMGYGRADAADGRVFPWIFNPPITYWAGADAIIQYIQAEEGGSLEGKKIALVYHDRSEERRVGKECRSRWAPYH